tara:strand:- start:1148 stop:1249 length:102 start_codon:yes stop_codon:yes gene_type:complete
VKALLKKCGGVDTLQAGGYGPLKKGLRKYKINL